MTLYKNKYRIESARCPKWDYTSNGYYFVTICTHDRQCFFGNIIDGKMQLSLIGKIVAQEWQKTEQIRPNVQLDEWVIMPNHIHGILIIQNPVETTQPMVETTQPIVQTTEPMVETTRRVVSTTRSQSNSLGSIIGQFKSVCTKQIWSANFSQFCWQTRFHDHIIRDEESLNHIRKYIINNPAKWEFDKHHPNR